MLELVKYPNHPLLQPCAPWSFRSEVEPVTGLPLRDVVGQMFDVMYANHGIGLAANQVGLAWRVFVADPDAYTERAGERAEVFVNPEILHSYGLQVGREGCLSLNPWVKFPVRRAEVVRLRWYDLDGRESEADCLGVVARLVQHEVDHLDGKCCIDLTDRFSREIALKKMAKLRRRARA